VIRSDELLHSLPATEWTEDESFSHLRHTFDLACRDFPEVLEPYANRLDGSLSVTESKQIMRDALRSTFNQRWPNRFLKLPEGT